jgi:hypothetical protein
MPVLALLMFLIGAALGARFKVFILVPATLVCIGLIIGLGSTVHGGSMSAMLLTSLLGGSCLQAGYLFGYVAQAAATRGLRQPKTALKVEPRTSSFHVPL